MNMKKFLKIALGTSLFILNQSDRARKSVRERVGDQVDDLREFAQDGYQAAADRIGRVADTIRGYDNHRTLWNVARFTCGLGVGIGVGLLVAPAKGEATRTKVAEKAQEFAGNVRQRFASSDLRATTTDD
jgi:hypothetical protein